MTFPFSVPRRRRSSAERWGLRAPGGAPTFSPSTSPRGRERRSSGAGRPLGDLPPTLPAGTRPSPGALGVGTGRRGILVLGEGECLLPSPRFIFSFPIFFWGGVGGEDMCVFSLTMGASAKCSLCSCPAGEPVQLPGPYFVHSIPGPRLGFLRALHHRQTLPPAPGPSAAPALPLASAELVLPCPALRSRVLFPRRRCTWGGQGAAGPLPAPRSSAGGLGPAAAGPPSPCASR